MQTLEQEMSEQATGIAEHPGGLGKIYAGAINRNGMCSDPGHELKTLAEIQDYMEEGGDIGIPNAGAGSYRKAFECMGFSKCENFENSSSAGDWSFAVFDGDYWYPAYQSNRYPRHGFSYTVDQLREFDTKDECFDYMGSQG